MARFCRKGVKIDGFKALNQYVHTKHIYSHDPHASEAILLILFMVFNLLGVYLHHCQQQLDWIISHE